MSSKTKKSTTHKRKKKGGFHDMASMLREFPEMATLSDAEKQSILNEQMGQRRSSFEHAAEDAKYGPAEIMMRQERDLEQAEYKRQDAEASARLAQANAQRAQAELQRERAAFQSQRMADQYELQNARNKPVLPLFVQRMSTDPLNDYFVKENIKREIKNEIVDAQLRAKRDKELAKLWASPAPKVYLPSSKPKSSTRSKSKSSTRSKSKSSVRSKSKSKSSVRSKSKSGKSKSRR